MLKEITKVAQMLNEIGAKNIQMTLDENQINQIKVELKSHLGMYGLTHPGLLDSEDLEISIWNVQFHLKKEPKKPEIIGKFKLANPSMLVDTGELGGLMRRINKSYWEREQQISDAWANGKEDLIDWASKKKSLKEISARLYNALIKTKPLYGLTLDQLTWEEYSKYRGCGKKGWEEFEKLRNKNKQNDKRNERLVV